MVYHRLRKERAQFRKLAFGQPCWIGTNLATAPLIKYKRGKTIGGWAADGSVTLGAVADIRTYYVKVPAPFSSQNEVSE